MIKKKRGIKFRVFVFRGLLRGNVITEMTVTKLATENEAQIPRQGKVECKRRALCALREASVENKYRRHNYLREGPLIQIQFPVWKVFG